MTKKKAHVVPSGDQWAVKVEGNKRASSLHPTQQKAITAATKTAKANKSSVVIHRPDGTIRDADSYGDESKKKDTKH
jgi:hypothetical protein